MFTAERIDVEYHIINNTQPYIEGETNETWNETKNLNGML